MQAGPCGTNGWPGRSSGSGEAVRADLAMSRRRDAQLTGRRRRRTAAPFIASAAAGASRRLYATTTKPYIFSTKGKLTTSSKKGNCSSLNVFNIVNTH